MIEVKWKTLEGIDVADMRASFKEILSAGKREIHIGTDSQQKGRFTEYVTVVVLLDEGKGGRAFFTSEKVPRIKSLRERLMKEVWMSVITGIELNDIIPEKYGLTIHVDANPDTRFKSSGYVKELTSMVVSQGFNAVLKPESWCASHAADHVVKKICRP